MGYRRKILRNDSAVRAKKRMTQSGILSANARNIQLDFRFGYTTCHVQEHAAVNRRVVGSSPTGGAKIVRSEKFDRTIHVFTRKSTPYMGSHRCNRLRSVLCWPEFFLKAPKSKGQVRPFLDAKNGIKIFFPCAQLTMAGRFSFATFRGRLFSFPPHTPP